MFPFSLPGFILALVHVHKINSMIPQSYFGVTSSQYINKTINVPSSRVLKLNFGDCSRQCMLDGSCWSWYVYPNNGTGTSNCVLVPTNICHQSSLNLSTATWATQLWEKLVDFPVPCLARGLIVNVTAAPAALMTNITITTIPAVSSTTMISTITSTSTVGTTTLPTCTATQCNRSCKDCSATGSGIIQQMLDHTVRICTIWPYGPNGSIVTLACSDQKPVLLYREVAYNTSFVNESILTPKEMYMMQDVHNFTTTLEIRFRTLATNGDTKASQFTGMPFFDPAGQLSLQNYTQWDSDPFGVPIFNATFVNGTAHPACGPFWNLSTSPLMANNGTAFGASPCPGYRTAFYGKPGLYNGTWSSGMTFASRPNDIILGILMYLL